MDQYCFVYSQYHYLCVVKVSIWFQTHKENKKQLMTKQLNNNSDKSYFFQKKRKWKKNER